MTKKNKQSQKKQVYAKLPKWNLGDLYPSINSKKINFDLDSIERLSKSFEKKYENKISKLSSLQLYNAILELEKIDEMMDKILSYSHLLVAENLDNEKNKIFFQKMQEKITNFSSFLIFFTLELNQLSEKKINFLFKNNKI